MNTDKQDIDEMAQHLSELARRAQQVFRVPDKDLGLSPTQIAILSRLIEGPLRIGELARSSGAAQNTMSEVVERMKRKGLVNKQRDQSDQRVVLVAITDKGRKSLLELRAALKDLHRKLLEVLEPNERQLLLQSVSTLVRLMEAAAEKMENTPSSRRP